MKSILVIVTCLFANLALAASPPVGKSTLKLEQPTSGVREARKDLDQVEKEIAKLDVQIKETRTQSVALQGQRGSPTQIANLKALENSYSLYRADLVAKREKLRSDMQFVAE